MTVNVREFLERVLPWPGDDGPGFINTHVNGTFPDGKRFWSGTPTKDVDSFLQAVHGTASWSKPPDVYMCMSRQRDTKPPNAQGKIHAAKSQASALFLKSIYLDVDVGKKGAYASLGDALAAVKRFCAKAAIPGPTALVASGGGLHVYWFSDKPLTLAEWQPYANGLKALALEHGLLCDAGVTGDAARILRVPGTFNYKTGTPRPVKLLGMKENDYDFANNLAALPGVAPALPNPAPGGLPGKPNPLFALLPVESLAEGIREEYKPRDPLGLIRECPFFKDVLQTGGKDCSQGLWNLSVLTSVFVENGHALAHKMSAGHAGYSHDETEALWERKQNEHRNRGLGWPSCRAIQGEGSTHCATCPHLASGQSPLHFAGVYAPLASQRALAHTPEIPPSVENFPTATVTVTPNVVVPLVDSDLPKQYVIKDKVVNIVVDKEDPGGGPPTQTIIPIFFCELFKPWAQSGPDALNFMASTSLGNIVKVCIEQKNFGPNKLLDSLLEQGVKYIVENKRYVEGFIMSWLDKLHKAAAARASQPFGWMIEEGLCTGFSYGGVIYRPDGSTDPAGMIDAKLTARYTPTGKLQPWLDACKLLTDQRRPGVEIIAAVAFGSPIMFAGGEYGALISVFSESGANKTTAQRIGLAVWGHPKITKETPQSTVKGVLNNMGQTKVLPSYWDEILNEEGLEKVHEVLWTQVLGNEGSRLNSKIEQQSKGDWQNIGVLCSNKCFGDLVIKKNPDTKAGLVRILEYEEQIPSQKGRKSTADAAQFSQVLDTNFGMMGREYAKVLAENRDAIHKRALAIANEIITELALQGHERFWPVVCAAILTGAEYANTIGCDFHVPEMRAFMIEKIKWNRARIADQHIGSGVSRTEFQLTAFLKAYTRNTVRTQTLPMKKPGRAQSVQVHSHPQPGMPVHVHWVLGNSELRFSQSEFNTWLRDPRQNGSPQGAISALRKTMNARTERGKLGIGTQYVSSGEMMVIIPVLPDTDLDTTMRAYSDPNAPGAGPGAEAQTPSDTGIMQALASNKDFKGLDHLDKGA